MNPISFLSFLSAAPTSGGFGGKPESMPGKGLDFQRALASALNGETKFPENDAAGVAEGFLRRMREVVKETGTPKDVAELDDTVQAAAAAMEQLGERLMRELAAVGERGELQQMLSGMLERLGIEGSEYKNLMAEFASVETLGDFAAFRENLVEALRMNGVEVDEGAGQGPLRHTAMHNSAATEGETAPAETPTTENAKPSAEAGAGHEAAVDGDVDMVAASVRAAGGEATADGDETGARATGRHRAFMNVDANTPEQAKARQQLASALAEDGDAEAPKPGARSDADGLKVVKGEAKGEAKADVKAASSDAAGKASQTGEFRETMKKAEVKLEGDSKSSRTDESADADESPRTPRAERVQANAKVDAENVVKQKEAAAPKEGFEVKADVKMDVSKSVEHANVKESADPLRGEMKAELKMSGARDTVRFAELIDTARANGAKKLTVQLQPEHLGKVKIELVDNAGKISARVTVESESARQMLAQGSDSLRQQLEAKGIQIQDMDFTFEESGFGNEMKERRELYQQMAKNGNRKNGTGMTGEIAASGEAPAPETSRGLYA